jgi:hypothetical protein
MSPFPFFKARLLGSLEMASKYYYGKIVSWERNLYMKFNNYILSLNGVQLMCKVAREVVGGPEGP